MFGERNGGEIMRKKIKPLREQTVQQEPGSTAQIKQRANN